MPPILLLSALFWTIREGRSLPRPRRRAFVAGLLSSTIAYSAHFLLRWYLRGAHLSYWARVDTTVGIGGLMFLAAAVGVVAGSFGKGYGRISALLAGITVAALWWFTGIATL